MVMRPTAEAIDLFHKGAIVLSRMEANGMRIDVPRLKANRQDAKRRVAALQEEMKNDPTYKVWKREFGTKTNLGSRSQLGRVVFGVLDYPCSTFTAKLDKHGKPKPKTDGEAFEDIDLPFVKKFLECEKWKKADNTFMDGIERELAGNFLHGSYGLNIARTYRSNSDNPDMQNFPIRDPEMGKLIRECFISRGEDYAIAEIDESGAEVRAAACYHKDPVMISYIKDKTKDMHRDMAAQIYMLAPEQVSKLARYAAKNMYVFPEFYGSYYVNCAPALWRVIDKFNLEVDGMSLKDHLKSKGIRDRGDCIPGVDPRPKTFEYHLKQVEQDFWGRRFKVYNQWKRDWFAKYQRLGECLTLTGFHIHGVYSKNQIINYPIQGSAFHWLLWSLVELDRWLRKYKMKTCIIGQIHDSILLDLYWKERHTVLQKVKEVMTEDLREHWKWINVPLEIEAEVSPRGKSWYDKKPWELN